jgi:co-chaperonin GroES (HSP10)
MDNKSGIQPIEYKVLVLPDTLSDQTAGGIIRPDRVKEIEQAAAVRGYLVAFGGKAFEDFGYPIPKIGDRIQYAKYSGVHQVPGADGKQYILCNDKDIAAIITQEELVIKVIKERTPDKAITETEEKYRFNPEIANYEREE